MKINLLNISAAICLLIPTVNFGQAPNMGTTTQFALFTTTGAITNTGISQVTGNVGSNSGGSTGFGNVNGVMNDQNGASGLATSDLLNAYSQLSNTVPTDSIAPALGGGQTLTAGVYYLPAATAFNGTLTLDALGNSNSVFIFQIAGAFSTGANAKVKLRNNALACNVFWQIEGEVNMAAGTVMCGSVIANNFAIHMNANDTLEGRALAIAGAITIDGVLVYTPTGCNSPYLTGPNAPALGSTSCFGIFTASGALTNSSPLNTHVIGDIGTNVGATTGFNPAYITGNIHTEDGSSAACAADLGNLYTELNTLPYDIELLYPAQFGRNLVLTPHTYQMSAATFLKDTLYLNAENNADAVFVIKITGALSTSTYAKVLLINGTQAKNVFWKVYGAVEINNFSQFKGTIVATGAVALNNGSSFDGSVFTLAGDFTTDSINVTKTSVCVPTGIVSYNNKTTETLSIYPNPFSTSMNVVLNTNQVSECELQIFNVLGAVVLNTTIDHQSSTFETSNLPSGIYFYKVSSNNKIIQTGKLISQQ